MPSDRDGYIDAAANMFSVIGSPGYPPDEERLRALIGASYDRSYYPVGFMRQLAGDPGLGRPHRGDRLASRRRRS